MATIEQLVLKRECLVEEDMRSKTSWHAFAGKLVDRVRTKLMVRDMDVETQNVLDARRLEVVVDGLPVRWRAQVAIDTTMVCALHRDGTPRRGAATHDGVAPPSGTEEERTHIPDRVDGRSLWFVALEVGGRWSEETRAFVSALGIARARHELPDEETC